MEQESLDFLTVAERGKFLGNISSSIHLAFSWSLHLEAFL
jgi:hypothetical protein